MVYIFRYGLCSPFTLRIFCVYRKFEYHEEHNDYLSIALQLEFLQVL